jgi:hypothetical protein
MRRANQYIVDEQRNTMSDSLMEEPFQNGNSGAES